MTAVKFTFDTHFETGAARAEAAKRSRRSYSSDELDLIRLAEAYPELKDLYPSELRDLLDRG